MTKKKYIEDNSETEKLVEKSLLELMKEKIESWNVTFTEFSLEYKNNSDKLYCFFEGKDDVKYYGIRISHTTGKDFFDYVCNSKENVIKLNKKINSQPAYNDSKILYFIDKDYSKIINPKQIYTTPCYSIENLYSNQNCLKRILSYEFRLKANDVDFNKIIKTHDKLKDKFHTKTLILNSWLACQNDLRENNLTQRLLIDEKLKTYMKNIVNVDMKDIKDLSDLSNPKHIEELIFSGCRKIKKNDLNKKKLYFDHNYSMLFRGKFEIKFFTSFLDRLKGELCKKKCNQITFSKSYNCNISFQDSNILSTLSQYAENPKCLTKYLSNFK